jgi:DNA-binding transcriptional MerR regulator
MAEKEISALKTISEVAKEIGLVDERTGKAKTHVIRFWEKKFKQLKPSVILNKHRYYSNKQIQILKKIKDLLKNKGLTIKGANKVLETEYNVDYNKSNNINAHTKVKNIKKIIKEIKKII